MSKKQYFTNEEVLQNAKVLFDTIKNNAQIAQQLEEYGYGQPEIEQGKTLYAKAEAQAQSNKKETEEEKVAYIHFKQKMDTLTSTYQDHRKKTKLVYRENAIAIEKLQLKGRSAAVITTLLDEMNTFYHHLNTDDGLRTPLKRVKIAKEHIEQQLALITETKDLYSTYAQEKNESQQATKDKNKAFADLDKWLRDCYAYAKIAFEDNPQFLQIFGKIIR